jgi:MoaA/NifB/PqqE/SkfB family radical SAM enzyme
MAPLSVEQTRAAFEANVPAWGEYTESTRGKLRHALILHHLKMFHDVEVSIDFPTQEEQDRFRGEGNWALVHQAIARSQRLSVRVSILTTLMAVLEPLMALAEKGTYLILCQTCLEFFGLRDAVRVGIVGGMGDIIAAMQRATKVISV